MTLIYLHLVSYRKDLFIKLWRTFRSCTMFLYFLLLLYSCQIKYCLNQKICLLLFCFCCSFFSKRPETNANCPPFVDWSVSAVYRERRCWVSAKTLFPRRHQEEVFLNQLTYGNLYWILAKIGIRFFTASLSLHAINQENAYTCL